MSTPTNSFPTVASVALSDTFMVNASATSSKITGTNVITALGLATLGGANVFTATNRFKTGGFNDMSIELGSATFGFAKYSTNNILIQTGNNLVAGAASAGGGFRSGFGVDANSMFGFGAGGDPISAQWDTALARSAAGVIEVNNSTAGGGAGLQLNEMTAPAGAANSARLFTQDLAGKTQLMVQFGSGVAQQLAIEL